MSNDEVTANNDNMTIDDTLSPKDKILCKHCGKSIHPSQFIGLSLLCPLCGKPQNGHPKDNNHPQNLMCKHCGKPIDQIQLRGISLLCPLCGKPQNGEPHVIA